MEMPTGKTIQTLRRQKGLTQEQLAEAVGVTAAAVSKWETASAYPDILLLCPLARALGTTPDILLDFRPLLSEEELKAICEKGRVLFESGRAEEACAYCEDILLSHPGDTALKFRIASLYMRYMAALKTKRSYKSNWNAPSACLRTARTARTPRPVRPHSTRCPACI